MEVATDNLWLENCSGGKYKILACDFLGTDGYNNIPIKWLSTVASIGHFDQSSNPYFKKIGRYLKTYEIILFSPLVKLY